MAGFFIFIWTYFFIKIQLKDSQNKVLYEVRTSGNNYVELFYENQPAFLKLDKTYIFARLSIYSNKEIFKVRFSTGILSSDLTGILKDIEDQNSIQEMQFTVPKK